MWINLMTKRTVKFAIGGMGPTSSFWFPVNSVEAVPLEKTNVRPLSTYCLANFLFEEVQKMDGKSWDVLNSDMEKIDLVPVLQFEEDGETMALKISIKASWLSPMNILCAGDSRFSTKFTFIGTTSVDGTPAYNDDGRTDAEVPLIYNHQGRPEIIGTLIANIADDVRHDLRTGQRWIHLELSLAVEICPIGFSCLLDRFLGRTEKLNQMRVGIGDCNDNEIIFLSFSDESTIPIAKHWMEGFGATFSKGHGTKGRGSDGGPFTVSIPDIITNIKKAHSYLTLLDGYLEGDVLMKPMDDFFHRLCIEEIMTDARMVIALFIIGEYTCCQPLEYMTQRVLKYQCQMWFSDDTIAELLLYTSDMNLIPSMKIYS